MFHGALAIISGIITFIPPFTIWSVISAIVSILQFYNTYKSHRASTSASITSNSTCSAQVIRADGSID